ncbi:sugar phosphate isomerase/epimerase [Mycetocola sp. 2940]|uniref:sugar phosphate isomerase/epimerase family protein n=1 Tax=Mycetocola sp. 2940 TaxID=3156452 RepID=UPI0033913A42
MPTGDRIRFGTNLITFFESSFWGLTPHLPHAQWAAAVNENPKHYFDGMLDAARDSGVEGVELAPDPGGFETAITAYGSAAAFADAVADRGLVLTSSYSPGRTYIGEAMADPALEGRADEYFERHARFLVAVGAATITLGSVPRSRFGNASPDDTATPEDFSAPVAREVHEKYADHLNRLAAVVAPFGVKFAIHTDAYSICARNEDIATVLSLTDPATVQLCPDAGHITLDGGDPVAVLRSHIDRIPTMHWKDCIGPLGGHTLRGDPKARHDIMLKNFRILGAGIVDWSEWMRILRDNDWAGWAIEEIDNSPQPIVELRQGLDFYRRELQRIYG